MFDKVAFAPDKTTWQPSPLPGPITIVSTIDEHGAPNIAPKSWVTMAANRPPTVAFGCTVAHATARNALASGEFVMNIPAEPLAAAIWGMIETWGAERIARAGLTLLPASVVAPPLVGECRAHLECRVSHHVAIGADEMVIFGEIVAASADRDCLSGSTSEQYRALRPIFFLEDGTYATLDAVRRIGAVPPGGEECWLVEVGAVPVELETPELVAGHVGYLRQLRERGLLLAGGPLRDALQATESSGIYVLVAASRDEAQALAGADPFAQAGVTMRVRRWWRTW